MTFDITPASGGSTFHWFQSFQMFQTFHSFAASRFKVQSKVNDREERCRDRAVEKVCSCSCEFHWHVSRTRSRYC